MNRCDVLLGLLAGVLQADRALAQVPRRRVGYLSIEGLGFHWAARIDLVINASTANTRGLEIPSSIAMRAIVS